VRATAGLWLFCFSELFLFGALFASRFVLWGNTRPELSRSSNATSVCCQLHAGLRWLRPRRRKAFLRGALLAARWARYSYHGRRPEWNVFGLEESVRR
jgi:heme/copper-type cytochrome/quinol oxidase subunit 3